MSLTLDEIFDRSIPEPNSGCWIWTMNAPGEKYGTYRKGGKDYKAHRVSYELFHGKIPDGMCVCHKCDVMQCVNPDHLFAGSHQDNMRDKVSKDRHLLKLDRRAIEEIIKDTRTNAEIAKGYGVVPSVIAFHKIRNRGVIVKRVSSDVREKIVSDIRKHSQIAKEYGVSRPTVSRIKREAKNG